MYFYYIYCERVENIVEKGENAGYMFVKNAIYRKQFIVSFLLLCIYLHTFQLKDSNKNIVQTYAKEKEVADVLLDFPSHRLSWKQFLVCLKPLQPRYYSISSSPKLVSLVVVYLLFLYFQLTFFSETF